MMLRRLNNSIIFVTEVNKKIVGFANYSLLKEEGKVELAAIYLHPENQGKGLGTVLLKEGINTLNGVKEIFINVEKENKIGITFYEAKGFKLVSEFDDNFEGHILKTVRMMLKV